MHAEYKRNVSYFIHMLIRMRNAFRREVHDYIKAACTYNFHCHGKVSTITLTFFLVNMLINIMFSSFLFKCKSTDIFLKHNTELRGHRSRTDKKLFSDPGHVCFTALKSTNKNFNNNWINSPLGDFNLLIFVFKADYFKIWW